MDLTKIFDRLCSIRCKALPFFHAFTGCDSISAFHGRGKTSCWQAWRAYGDVSDALIALNDLAFRKFDTASVFSQIELFVVIMYNRTSNLDNGGGGLLMYVNDNIPSRKLTEYSLPADIEIMCVELNLKKQKWIVIGIYRPTKMNEKYFLDHLSRVVDFYSKAYDRVLIMSDFNSEPCDEAYRRLVMAITYIILSKKKLVPKVSLNVTT